MHPSHASAHSREIICLSSNRSCLLNIHDLPTVLTLYQGLAIIIFLHHLLNINLGHIWTHQALRWGIPLIGRPSPTIWVWICWGCIILTGQLDNGAPCPAGGPCIAGGGGACPIGAPCGVGAPWPAVEGGIGVDIGGARVEGAMEFSPTSERGVQGAGHRRGKKVLGKLSALALTGVVGDFDGEVGEDALGIGRSSVVSWTSSEDSSISALAACEGHCCLMSASTIQWSSLR